MRLRPRASGSIEPPRAIVAPNLPHAPIFSLSHTEGMAACLIGLSARAGVDVEKLAYHRDLPRMASSIFAAGELQNLRGHFGADWTARFFQYWTLKEAYAKARGLGLRLRPRDINFEIAAGGAIRGYFAAALRDDLSRWFFRSYRPSPTHVLSLAVAAPSEIVVRSFTFQTVSLLPCRVFLLERKSA